MSPCSRLQLLILQPTPFCNINCTYCYLPARDEKHRMSQAVLEATCRAVVESGLLGPQLSVVWHAGEPLVMPHDYYTSQFAVIEQHLAASTEVTHHFQTNGMLIDDAWCEIFRSPKVRVGVSVDGPRKLHDSHRIDRAGRGSFDRTMAGLHKLVDGGIDFHVITVLTRTALFFPDELYDFYVRNNIRHVCFNIEEIEGVNPKSSLDDARCYELYGRFFTRFLDLVSGGTDIKSVREFDLPLGQSEEDSSRSPSANNQQTDPFAILAVAHNGDFSTYSPELLGMKDLVRGDFVLGNVMRDSIGNARRTEKFKGLELEIAEGVEHCRRTCRHFALCGGGAPANKLYEHGRFDATETMYCRYTVKLLSDLAAARRAMRPSPASLPRQGEPA